MTAPQTLVQAALSRLAARLGSGAVDAAANLALLAQDAPERVRQELQLFWDEVQLEADRLERGVADVGPQATADQAEADQPAGAIPRTRPGDGLQNSDVQALIDGLRAQVARLSRGLEQRP